MPRSYEVRPHFKYFAAWAGLEYMVTPVPDTGRDIFTVDVANFRQSLSSLVTTVRQRIVQYKPSSSSSSKGTTVTPTPLNLKPTPDDIPTDTSKPEFINPNHLDNPLKSNLPLEELTKRAVGGHRLAVVIPFRDSPDKSSQGGNRTANLNDAIPYLVNWLSTPLTPGGPVRQAGKDFIIIISEQTPGHIFNKGAIFNAGFDQIKDVADYMALHDVDQVSNTIALSSPTRWFVLIFIDIVDNSYQ
jgi:hypothetical protein